MNKAILAGITQYSVVVAAIIALVRFKKAAPSYLPFFVFILAGFTNEIISYFTIHYLRNNAINSNIYVLAESLILLWLFWCWRLFDFRSKLPFVLGSAFILFWIGEVFFYASIMQFAAYFRVFYSFVIVLLSITMVNRLITEERGNLLKNAAFIICIAFIIYFTYKVLVEIFYIYGVIVSVSNPEYQRIKLENPELYKQMMEGNKAFRIRVFDIMRFINLFCNLVYAVALLWVPRKNSSLMPSS